MLISILITYHSKCLFVRPSSITWESPHSVVASMLDRNTVVSEFKFQSLYYVHFPINTLEKGMNPLILSSMVVSILLYVCTTWSLTKHEEKAR